MTTNHDNHLINSAVQQSLGLWLTQTRIRKRVEQKDVASNLGIDLSIIQDIEADKFNSLGPPVFVRGYLKRYAKFLNLPEQEVLEQYQLQSGANETPLKIIYPLCQTRMKDLRGIFYLSILVLACLIIIQNFSDLIPGYWLNRFDQSNNIQQSLAQPDQTDYQQEIDSNSNIRPNDNNINTIKTVENNILTNTAPNTNVASTSLAPSDQSNNRLLLEFKMDCWLEIKDASGHITSGLMKANSNRTILGLAPFKITLGNAPAVQITLDDKIVKDDIYIPRRGTVSHFVLGQP